MDPTVTVAVLSVFGTLITSIGVGAVILRWMNRRQAKAELENKNLQNQQLKTQHGLDEADAMEKFETKLKSLFAEKLANAELIQGIQAEKAAAELMIRIKEGQNHDLHLRIESVILEQGRSMQREEQCAKDLATARRAILDLNKKFDALSGSQVECDDIRGKNKTISGQLMQAVGILQELRLSGVWQGDETEILAEDSEAPEWIKSTE